MGPGEGASVCLGRSQALVLLLREGEKSAWHLYFCHSSNDCFCREFCSCLMCIFFCGAGAGNQARHWPLKTLFLPWQAHLFGA